MSLKPIAVVTGGAGFIGSHMVDHLVDQGYAVRVIDNLVGGRQENLSKHSANPDLVLEERDIRSYSSKDPLFKNAKLVFHFAGIGDIVPSIENPAEYMSANVQGTVSMLECARYAGVDKFVYAASSSCYGLAKTPTTEDHPIDTKYPYALSKYQGEQAAFHWHHVYKLPVNVIRIFNAYGTRSRTSGAYGAVFGVFLRQKIGNQPFTVVGDGMQTRDFLYVTDVAKAFYAAGVSNTVGRVYNLGAGKPQSVNRLVIRRDDRSPRRDSRIERHPRHRFAGASNDARENPPRSERAPSNEDGVLTTGTGDLYRFDGLSQAGSRFCGRMNRKENP
jgi:UDP-glucose 4-epimerase